MQLPAVDDTIVAVSSGWSSSPIAIIRLSGPEAFPLAGELGAEFPTGCAPPCWTAGRLTLHTDLSVPVTCLWFRRPRSYTGQDVVELHTTGCLPLVRELCGRLIDAGARRALPGEFTARAYLGGKLDGEQVEDILALLRAGAVSDLRRRQRTLRTARANLETRLLDLLALIEAGIDFAEEEDIRFITPAEVVAQLDERLADVAALRESHGSEARSDRPHVAIVGLANAGKSTLFNALIGSERAIVSPVLGTTRDVLSADIELEGSAIVLQDCAGFGATDNETELAAQLGSEGVAGSADLALWAHDSGVAWSELEERLVGRMPRDRCILVWTKADAGAEISVAARGAWLGECTVSAVTGAGLSVLRHAIAAGVSSFRGAASVCGAGEALGAVEAALRRARDVAMQTMTVLESPEIIALEIRSALSSLSETGHGEAVESVLSRVFGQFCVGK